MDHGFVPANSDLSYILPEEAICEDVARSYPGKGVLGPRHLGTAAADK